MVQELTNATYAFAARIDNVKEAASGNTVLAGCAVTPQGTPDMTVDIASGTIRIGGVTVTVSLVDNQVVTAADGSNDRWDIIEVGANGTVDYTAGTPAANPLPPDLAADHVLLALILVETGSSTVETADIQDNRIINDEGLKIKFGGVDQSLTAHAADTNETELLSVVIPADTFSTGARIKIDTLTESGAAESVVATYRVKTGADGSETTRHTRVVTQAASVTDEYATINYYDTAADYTAEVSIILTVQLSDASGSRSGAGVTLEVTGH